MNLIELKHKQPSRDAVVAGFNASLNAARKTANQNTGCAAMAVGLVLITIATVAAIAAAAS